LDTFSILVERANAKLKRPPQGPKSPKKCRKQPAEFGHAVGKFQHKLVERLYVSFNIVISVTGVGHGFIIMTGLVLGSVIHSNKDLTLILAPGTFNYILDVADCIFSGWSHSNRRHHEQGVHDGHLGKQRIHPF
jgi:hypothetical protein